MDRREFMDRLAYLLSDLSEEDRREAILYYEDYFDDAGPDREGEVIQELGSPERVAAMVKNGYEEAGEFTETGYENARYKEKPYEVIRRGGKAGSKEGDAKAEGRGNGENKDNTIKFLIIAGCCFFVIPLIFNMLGGIFSGIMGIIGLLFTLFFSVAGFTFKFLGNGIGELFSALTHIFTSPLYGMYHFGCGILYLGVSLLMLAFAIWFYGKLIPRVFRAITGFFRGLLGKNKGEASR